MSFQWTFIAGYLYFEIAVVIVMMLPIASPKRWRQFFRSRLFTYVKDQAGVYFCVLLGVLILFLFDAVREMRKYSHSTDTSHTHIASEMKGNVKLFRAQRNFYITGFSIFLAFVIKRLVTMILIQAELLDKSEKIIKEAETAKNLAKTTVLAHTLQSAGDSENVDILKTQLKILEDLLNSEQERCKELESEVTSWKTKYETVAVKSAVMSE